MRYETFRNTLRNWLRVPVPKILLLMLICGLGGMTAGLPFLVGAGIGGAVGCFAAMLYG